MKNELDILLVEDNPDDVEITLRAFQKHNFVDKFHVVRDGEEALEYLFGTEGATQKSVCSNIRLILLDLKIPKIDGMEVLQRCKSDPRTKHIPVVVLTASREERDLTDTYNLGVNSYIVKPVDFSQFTETVRQLGLYWIGLNRIPSEIFSA